jgi:hypothetical protein
VFAFLFLEKRRVVQCGTVGGCVGRGAWCRHATDIVWGREWVQISLDLFGLNHGFDPYEQIIYEFQSNK